MADWTIRLGKGPLPDRALIGGKAWSIARMTELGLPVPPAFVITTRACAAWQGGDELPEGLGEEVRARMHWLEVQTGRRFGAGPNPLLVSVRSGAAISMPGMMDTVLNIGIDVITEAALAAETGDIAFAHDTHRRFCQLFGEIVLGAVDIELDSRGGPEQWNAALDRATGNHVPSSPEECLFAAIRAVFRSWNSRRAKRYRRHNGIPDDLGTAVTIQAMVFGNLPRRSGTGVLFSRNPVNGAPNPYGEFLPNAQGEDVVSGRRTPLSLEAMRQAMPQVEAQLLAAAKTIEIAGGDVQDIEFTVQDGKLYILQSRVAKRSPAAALRFAIDLLREGHIDAATALGRVAPEQLRSLLLPRLDPAAAHIADLLAQGETACPGIGIGTVVTDPDEAETRSAHGDAVILARATTSPEDVHGIVSARALITELGGSTSHAAVVCRAMGIPCITGCGQGAVTSLAGREITVDASAGKVYASALQTIEPDIDDDPYLSTFAEIITAHAPVKVVGNADELPPGVSVLDLDDEEPENASDNYHKLTSLLSEVHAARGLVFNTDVGVQAALEAKLKFIVATSPLSIALRLARAALSHHTHANDRSSMSR